MTYGKVLECLVVVGCVTLAEAASWSDEVKDVKKGASVFVREPLDLSFADGIEMDGDSSRSTRSSNPSCPSWRWVRRMI